MTDDRMETVRAAMERLAAAVCRHPDGLKVEAISNSHAVKLLATTHPEDYGAVLGVKQVMLSAFRTLARALGNAAGLTVEFLLVEREKGAAAQRAPFIEDRAWKPHGLEALLVTELAPLVRGTIHADWQETGKWWVGKLYVDGIVECGETLAQLDSALARLATAISGKEGSRVLLELVGGKGAA